MNFMGGPVDPARLDIGGMRTQNQNFTQFNAKIKKFDKLQYVHQIDVKNSNGKFSGGRKVTGIEFFNDNIVMVTTNDSRVRFINIVTRKILMKIKGNKNESFHLRASLSPSRDHVLCGSENGDVFLWSQIAS